MWATAIADHYRPCAHNKNMRLIPVPELEDRDELGTLDPPPPPGGVLFSFAFAESSRVYRVYFLLLDGAQSR